MRRPWLPLLACMLFVQGCGLGWLYLKIGDSKRIAGLKLLSYDTRADRFERAQKAFKGAIGYYNDSILYDELSNLDVYHKKGYTHLMQPANDKYELYKRRTNARSAFLTGLNRIRQMADIEKKTQLIVGLEQEVRVELQMNGEYEGVIPVPEEMGDEQSDELLAFYSDENYARCHAGLGQMAFLDAISERTDAKYKLALFHYELAARATAHRRGGSTKKSPLDRVLDFFNLHEIYEKVPYIVEKAKIHNYLAQNYRKRGETKLQEFHHKRAREALDEATETYPDDLRVSAELARLAFYQGEFKKALSEIEKVVQNTEFYADKREFMLLQGQIYNEMGRFDEALQSFQWILDREEISEQALIGRARVFAAKKERNAAQADLTTLLQTSGEDEEPNPFLYREAGDVYMILGDRTAASQMYLKAYYIDKEDIELVYKLGKLYDELGESDQARDLMRKVIKINPISQWADKARDLLKRLGA